MKDLACVILAAGKSTRMKSQVSKVLHNLAGRPVISYPIEVAKKLKAAKILVVRGPDQKDLKEYLDKNKIEQKIEQVVQKQALGTGHAVSAAKNALKNFSGKVLILCGDVPLVDPETLSKFIKLSKSKKSVLSVLTMTLDEPAVYGRIVRDLDGRVICIVEAKDASSEELKIREVNSGILCCDSKWLFKSLSKLSNKNAKNEYYITDLVGIALKEGFSVASLHGEPAFNFMGINTRVDLAKIYETLRERTNKCHMDNGVGILDFRHTNIDVDVKIGQDTEIKPYTFIEFGTVIGKNCKIENGVVIKNSTIGNGVHIKAHSVIEDSRIFDDAIVGPFARIRPGSKVGKNARVGNFVELKKCDLKDGAKASHLTYLGDATIGKKVNVGCGTITCNYDGKHKYKTQIGDDVFIGSDTQFIAPVKIGRGALIGAGSTITKDVPADALSLSRAEQVIKKGGALKFKKRK